MKIIRTPGISDRIRYRIIAKSQKEAKVKATMNLKKDGFNLNSWTLKQVFKLFTNTYLVFFE